MHTIYGPTPQRGTQAYTSGGACVDVVEVVGQRVLVRQAMGCVEWDGARWVDHARLYWLEAYELEHESLPPKAWYGVRTPR